MRDNEAVKIKFVGKNRERTGFVLRQTKIRKDWFGISLTNLGCCTMLSCTYIATISFMFFIRDIKFVVNSHYLT